LIAIKRIAAIVVTVVAIAAAAWYLSAPGDDGAAVRKRLHQFADEVNASTVDGGGTEAHALRFASFFADDVDVDLGHGSAPIHGRETVLGMAERLQPRTAAFQLKLEDVTVAMGPGGDTADVHLTAEFIRRSITTGEESLDAREFTMMMKRAGGDWTIARVTAIETLTK
jgi:Domain of unknown function (DUF4440)